MSLVVGPALQMIKVWLECSGMQMDQRGYKLYWDEERETMDPKQKDTLILERLQEQLHYVYHHLPFYRRL